MKKHCFLFLIFVLPCFLFAKNIDVQDILNELNFIRTNPKGYIRVLKEHLNTFDGMVYIDGTGRRMRSHEGVDAVYECIEVLENTSPMQALKMNDNLCEAALWFAKDLAYFDNLGYVGSDGSSYLDRIERSGFSGRLTAEIVSCGRFTARDFVMSLLIDDGLSSRGNREIILNINFDNVGLGVAFGHSEWDSILVADFGKIFNYILPTPQEILNELNLVRSNPKGYVKFLKEHLNTFEGMVYIDDEGLEFPSAEGISAVLECIKVLENTSPMQTLTMNKNLCESALLFAKDSAIHSIRGHVGSDGSILKDRIDRAGFSPRSGCGEICDYGQYTARRHIMRFLIDDGVPSRGHRDNILNANFKYVGIGLATGDAECGTVVVADFGN